MILREIELHQFSAHFSAEASQPLLDEVLKNLNVLQGQSDEKRPTPRRRTFTPQPACQNSTEPLANHKQKMIAPFVEAVERVLNAYGGRRILEARG